MSSKSRTTEANAYIHNDTELKALGWDTTNPIKRPHGQVYTQNESLSDPEIKPWLDKKRPESIVKVHARARRTYK